jgi:hypothetical protein
VRLFRAWSMVDNFLGQDQVKLDWFVVGRTAPPAPYHELISDYDENDENACYDEILANELFTETELQGLENYLAEQHQLDLEWEELVLPLKKGILSYGLLLISGVKGFYALADESGYDLSMAVLGHYDAKEVNISASAALSEEDISLGSTFMEIILARMNINGIAKDEMQAWLQQIYTTEGLKVVKTKP